MTVQELFDHLPPRQDLVRFARYLGSLRRPARAMGLAARIGLASLAQVAVGAGLLVAARRVRGGGDAAP